MQFEQHFAYVLHSRAYRETSALMTFLTAEHGKFNAIVRGVHGPKAKRKTALTQPFQRLEIRWNAKFQADLVKLQAIEFSQLNFPLMARANICGLYANELLYRLLYPRMEARSIFQEYEQLLYQLLQTQQYSKIDQQPKIEWALRRFELLLISELVEGFALENIAAIQRQQRYHFIPESGWVVQSCHQGGILGAELQALHENTFTQSALVGLKRLMRQQIQQQLGNKPLNTRKLFS